MNDDFENILKEFSSEDMNKDSKEGLANSNEKVEKDDEFNVEDIQHNGDKKQKKKMPKWAKALLIILAILLVLVLIGVGLFEYSFSKLNWQSASSATENSSVTSDKTDSAFQDTAPTDTVKEDDGVTNILLVGVDNDNIGGIDKRGNADGLILLTINNKSKKIAVTSILREVYLEPAEGQGTEATLVYHYFGLEPLITGIEKALDIKIDNYMLFNYLNIMDIVDNLGGVDIELYNGEVSTINGKIGQINSLLLQDEYEDPFLPDNADGLTHLNGIQTAAYMRVRISDETNNDFGRTQRIRNVIMALKDKVLQLSLPELYSFANSTLPYITTDMSQTQALSLLSKIPALKNYSIVSGRIPVDGSYVEKDTAQHIDYEVNQNYLKDLCQ